MTLLLSLHEKAKRFMKVVSGGSEVISSGSELINCKLVILEGTRIMLVRTC